MAQALYANEILKGRIGQVSGALRFDICPGSTIKVEGVSDRFLPGDDPIGEDRYATVLRVTYYFDAENPRTGTAFNLAHIRNEKENEAEDTSVKRHPLYTRVWKGDKLLKDVNPPLAQQIEEANPIEGLPQDLDAADAAGLA